MFMLHSFSAADPYDPDTIAGRALWGGAYFYFGSAWEPFLESFQTPRYVAARVALGEPWTEALRVHNAEFASRPWRLLAIGDPRLTLRSAPLVRGGELPAALRGGTPVEAGDGADALARLRSARLAGAEDGEPLTAALAALSASALDVRGLVLAEETCLELGLLERAQQLWDGAPAATHQADAARLARIATQVRLDRAAGAKDLVAAERQLGELLGQRPAVNALERDLQQLTGLAGAQHQEEAWFAWLRAQAGGSASAATLLEDWPDHEGLGRLLAAQRWQQADADGAVAALVALAGHPRWDQELAGWLESACTHANGSLPDGRARLLAAVDQAGAGRPPLLKAVATVRRTVSYTKDWLMLGPFPEQPADSWTPFEAAAATAPGLIDPSRCWSDGHGGLRAWLRPDGPQDYGTVDLAALYGDAHDIHIYALALIDAGSAVSGWLQLGSQGSGLTVWLDGAILERQTEQRGQVLDQDHLPLQLALGVHTVLLRCDRHEGAWSFAARLSADKVGQSPLVGATWWSPRDPPAVPGSQPSP
jgi:hypothetical protein